MKKGRPSFADVRSQFDYDPEGGWLLRKNLRAKNMRPEAGSPNRNGEIVVGINGGHELAHRLIWLWVHGDWPPKQIEHINGDRSDNRIANLRLVNPKLKLPLTLERVKQVLNYERTLGKFFWRVPIKGIVFGEEAGAVRQNGYRVITIDGANHYAHRLVWFWENAGVWPTNWVDHINGDRDDNRIENLRDVSSSRNAHNTSKLGPRNSTGFRGVTRYADKFIAQIMVDGVLEAIGMYDTAKEASDAYEKRRLELFGERSHTCMKAYYRPSRAKKDLDE